METRRWWECYDPHPDPRWRKESMRLVRFLYRRAVVEGGLRHLVRFIRASCRHAADTLTALAEALDAVIVAVIPAEVEQALPVEHPPPPTGASLLVSTLVLAPAAPPLLVVERA